MNTSQLIESVQQVFPKVSRTQIRLDLDIAQKLIASDTGTITTVGSLSNPTTSVAWSLPAGFVELLEINLYDADYNPVYMESLNYTFEVVNDKLYIYSLSSTPISGLDCTYAQIVYKELPTTLSSESTDLELEEYYRDAIESYVLSKYFSKFPVPFVSGGQVVEALNLQAANFHRNNYNDLRIRLKREVNSRIKTDNHFYNYGFAGKMYLPKRSGEAVSSGTVTISSISDQYVKYAYFKVTTADDELEKDPIISTGYTTITATPSISGGNTVTLASPAEFDEETLITVNNWDATWVRNSASEIVFTLPAGWSTFSFEVYERD